MARFYACGGICGRLGSLAILSYLTKRHSLTLPFSFPSLRLLVSVCAQPAPDSVVEREWGRQAKEGRSCRAPVPLHQHRPGVVPGRSNGELWWRRALEKHTGEVGVFSQTIPWEALCKHSLAAYFLETLGDEGRNRPLLVSKRRAWM